MRLCFCEIGHCHKSGFGDAHLILVNENTITMVEMGRSFWETHDYYGFSKCELLLLRMPTSYALSLNFARREGSQTQTFFEQNCEANLELIFSLEKELGILLVLVNVLILCQPLPISHADPLMNTWLLQTKSRNSSTMKASTPQPSSQNLFVAIKDPVNVLWCVDKMRTVRHKNVVLWTMKLRCASVPP